MRRDFHFLGELTDEGMVEHDRDEVRQTLLDLEGAVYQLGGRVSMSAVRRQIGEDQYATVGVLISYDSFAPAAKIDAEVADVEEVEEVSADGAADTP